MHRKATLSISILLLALGSGLPAHAQVPTATGRCVLNCNAPAPAPSGGGVQPGGNPALNQMGYEMGRAVGRALTNQNQDGTYSTRPDAPGSASVQAARGQLDQWAREDDAPSGGIRDAAPKNWECYPPADNGNWLQCADERGHRRCFQRMQNGAVYEVECR
jgi:hypothetical protein